MSLLHSDSELVELIERIKFHKYKPTQGEVETLIEALNSEEEKFSIPLIIEFIGVSQLHQYIPTLEKILFGEEDASIISSIIKVLCDYFEATGSYLQYIKEGIRGYSWDTLNIVSMRCLHVATHYLRKTKDRDLAITIWRALETHNERQFSASLKQSIIEAMAMTVGYSAREIVEENLSEKDFDKEADFLRSVKDKFEEKYLTN